MSAPAELFLLAAAPDLVDDLGAEAHDVEGVEEGGGSSSRIALAYPRNGSRAACSTASMNSFAR